jgi:DNA-binding transcriptional ArsR family regulator
MTPLKDRQGTALSVPARAAVTDRHGAVVIYNLMVVGMAEAERADAVFHALADPTRRDILAVVLRDAHSVSDLARRYPISFAAVHKHVGALERAGLVTKTRHGREQRVRGEVATLRRAHGLLDDLETRWRGRIDRIEEILADPAVGAPQCP